MNRRAFRRAISIGFNHFEQAMGTAVRPGRVAIGTRRQIWFLHSAPDIAARVEPAGKYDACYLTRSAHFTGIIHGHEWEWAGDELSHQSRQWSGSRGVYSINPVASAGAATIVSTGPDAGTYLTGSAVVDHAITHVHASGTLENLALFTESASSGVAYLDPLTGVVRSGGFVLSVLNGGITIDGS